MYGIFTYIYHKFMADMSLNRAVGTKDSFIFLWFQMCLEKTSTLIALFKWQFYLDRIGSLSNECVESN